METIVRRRAGAMPPYLPMRAAKLVTDPEMRQAAFERALVKYPEIGYGRVYEPNRLVEALEILTECTSSEHTSWPISSMVHRFADWYGSEVTSMEFAMAGAFVTAPDGLADASARVRTPQECLYRSQSSRCLIIPAASRRKICDVCLAMRG